MTSPFFENEKACPVCDKKFKITRVRSSATVVLKRDTDFYVHYKSINPVHYSVYVCPHCHYAALDKTFADPLKPAEKMRLQKGLELLRKEEPDFSGERDSELALRATELAIISAQVKKTGPGLVGSLYLRAAWCARELEKTDLELKYIDQARVLYKESFEKERLLESRMPETRMMYLIGELHRRSGHYQEAVQWFSRVVTNRSIKKEPEIERLARDQWDEAKTQFKQQQKLEENEIIEVDTEVQNNTIEETAASSVVEKIEKSSTPKPKVRHKSKTYISIYNDQIDWLKKMSSQNYEKTKVLIEREIIIGAILDAVIELGLDPNKYNDELELQENIKKSLVDKIKAL